MRKYFIDRNNERVAINSYRTPVKTLLDIIYVAVGAVLALLFVFPIIYMLASATKTIGSYAVDAGTIRMFLPDFAHMNTFFANFTMVLGSYRIWRNAMNSFIYAAIVIVLNILVNGLAGYVMSKFDFPGKAFFSFIIFFLMIVPVETSIVPLYLIVKTVLKLKGSLSIIGVVLPSIVSVFNIFLLMQFFGSIPKDYEEAASLDGAGNLTIFFKIILPLSKPILATIAVFCFIGTWNDYLWPQMILNNEKFYPIQAAIEYIQTRSTITVGETMAALTVASIPIFVVYVAAQKYIVQGFGSAGLKM